MKQLNHIGILILFLLGSTISVQAQTVYITNTGKKYHKKSCHHLKYSKKTIEYKEALRLGYEGCKICKPKGTTTTKSTPTKKTYATQCTGKTKSGKRCKRQTKNSSGRCYQH